MYHIDTIPTPPSTEHVRRYADFRLLSLRTDPSSFGSTYAREIAFDEAVWRDRLTPEDRATIVAKRSPGEDVGEEDDWVGIATLFTSDAVIPPGSSGVPSLPGADGDKERAVYMLPGMWIQPKHRRRGVAKLLVDAAVRRIEDMEGKRRSGGSKIENHEAKREVVLGLTVNKNNVGARDFYRAYGFMEVEETAGISEGLDKTTVSMYLRVG